MMRVLVIEDNISTQSLFVQALKSLGFKVYAFVEAKAAWQAYQRQPCPTDRHRLDTARHERT